MDAAIAASPRPRRQHGPPPASVISLRELLATTTRASSASLRYTAFYTVALVYYLAIVSALMLVQVRLEQRLAMQGRQA